MRSAWTRRVTALAVSCCATLGLTVTAPAARADSASGVSIEDCIRYENIHLLALTADGTRLAALTWHGDLAARTNVMSLYVFDTGNTSPAPPMPVLSFPVGVPRATGTTALSQYFVEDLQWVNRGKTVVFLATLPGQKRQVQAIDVEERKLRAVTNHPTDVTAYSISADGNTVVYEALGGADIQEEVERDFWGYSIFGRGVDADTHLAAILAADIIVPHVNDVFVRTGKAGPRFLFDTKPMKNGPVLDIDRSRQTGKIGEAPRLLRAAAGVWVSPDGSKAIVRPYLQPGAVTRIARYESAVREVQRKFDARSGGEPWLPVVASDYGVADLETGQQRRLFDGPFLWSSSQADAVLWSPDSRSVILHALLPLDGLDAAERERRAALPPQWVEVDVSTGGAAPLNIESGWNPHSWTERGLLFARGPEIAELPRRGARWGALRPLGVAGFNTRYPIATDGHLVAGVRDSLMRPPQIAVRTLGHSEERVLTNPNLWLRERSLGPVEKIAWAGPFGDASFGHLIRPVGYEPGKRYPLVVLIKDEAADPSDESFILDGLRQRIGFAIQPLAAHGFMVLLTPLIPTEKWPGVMGKPAEATMQQAHLRAGIRELDRLGLIDPSRVGLAGWSRAAYHTEKALLDGLPVHAAIAYDGGSIEYAEGQGSIPRQFFSQEQLTAVQAPLLIEACGVSVFHHSYTATRLLQLGKAVDLDHYPSGHHNLLGPGNRWTSLTNSVDWFRFWLKGEENPDPRLADRNARWRRMRDELVFGPAAPALPPQAARSE